MTRPKARVRRENGEWVASRPTLGFGAAVDGSPVDAATLFGLGSISKGVTGVVVASLAADFAVLLTVFALLTPRPREIRDLLPGVALASVGALATPSPATGAERMWVGFHDDPRYRWVSDRMARVRRSKE